MLLLSITELCQSIWTLYVSVWRERAVRVFVIEEWLTAVVVCERVPFPQDALTVTLPFSTFVPIFSPESRSPQWQMRLRLWQKGSCALGCCEQTQTRIRTSQITSIMPYTLMRGINSKIWQEKCMLQMHFTTWNKSVSNTQTSHSKIKWWVL